MVEEKDAFIQTVQAVQLEIRICVKRMVVERGVFIHTVRKVHWERLIYVESMVEAHDVPIVFPGLTHDQVIKDMMATVPPVSNISFQKIHEVKSFMPIRKRSVFVTRSMNSLKGLSMINPSIQVIATAP
jgi:hypothetical protein